MDKDPSQIAADLAPVLRGDVFADLIHRAAASIDASIYRIVPQCVVVPRGIDDVAAVMRYASQEAIPVAARGAGSGVAGESLCRGIVLDMAGRSGGDVEVLHDGEKVSCEPGAVLDDVNRALAPYGRMVGPDPSSGNRATVGGCVANNATGAHSLLYGHMADHVWALEGVLADGTVVPFHNGVRPDPSGIGRAQQLAARCLEILSQGAEGIQRAVPNAKRARMGYSVAGVCHEDRVDMAKLMSGSEGTLGVLTRISLATVPLPAAKGLLELEFDSLQAMAQAVPILVEAGVSACELMDRTLMDMARSALPQYRDLFPKEGAAVLMVEHFGADPREVVEKLILTDKAVGPLARGRQVLDPAEQRRLWKSRKDAVPLLYRQRGTRQPVAFVEDTCVDPARLGEYLQGLEAMGRRHGVTLCYYGHAGDGELHVRPYLDLGDPEDVRRMRQIAEEVFSLVWSLGGSISGEHAYGLVRAGFVRRQFGDAYVEVLRRIKQAFDPQGIMNPGKVVNDDPDVMTRDLRRSRAFLPERMRSGLRFGPDELALEILQCNGCGLCRAGGGDQRMCPVFQALGEELATPRAKANLLDLWATGQLDPDQFESPEFRRVLDLCVHCKACQRDCPSGVDVSKLILAAKAEYADRKGLRRTDRILAQNRLLGSLGTAFTPVANAALASR
ncbi:MAG: FAD-binding protein, partial [Phycisphaerae bacterium]|nr:FAD-binding protein [Phycisphaerae bacterium]